MNNIVHKYHLELLNTFFDIERKKENTVNIDRQLSRVKRIFENCFDEVGGGGLFLLNPIGEPYEFTRTDCEASVTGSNVENLYIIEVLKPIIAYRHNGEQTIMQKGIVIVASKDK